MMRKREREKVRKDTTTRKRTYPRIEEDSSLQCIKYHLTEARIANCYYPGDNKTVTIFADSERGRRHE